MQTMSLLRRVGAVCGRDLGELRKSPAFAVLLVAFAALFVGISVGTGLLVRSVLRETVGLDAPAIDGIVKGVVGGFLVENVLYAVTMLPYALIVWVFAGALVMREKLSGNLETLLATPLDLSEIWLGKTLAIVAASTGIGWLCGALSVVSAHVIVAVAVSHFVPLVSAPAAVAAVLLNPLFFSGMCALIILIALVKDADASLLPSFLIGMGAMIGLPVVIGTGAIVIGSWIFCLYQFCAAVVLWLAVIVLLLTSRKERVVLSARN
ncbi:MAG: hypothetical protein NTV92_03705 [Candidatus Bipolaricaulota bacterium]|nr:hypothetical protein [Candidatus Bipolaricaulota bacterium]